MFKKSESEVYLEPIKHVYIHKKTNKKYKSVTTILNSIEHEFKTEDIAQAIENQDEKDKKEIYVGMSKKEIINYWQKINDEANEYGTHIHELIEQYLLKNKWFFPSNEFDKKVIKEFEKLNVDLGSSYCPEKVVFSEKYEIAGSVDLLIDIDDEFFDIGDHKTNKVINYYSPFKQLLKPPFDYLQDCQYVIYTLQLSIYALLYSMETGKRCRQIWISYWNKEYESWEKIPIMYLKHEALKLLELHKLKKL